MTTMRRALLIYAALLAVASGAERQRIAFSRLIPAEIGLYVADADGRNERRLLADAEYNYNPSFSADGKWILFTSERDGSADIYRVRPDGTGLERITESPSYDDQAALSPDGRTLAFVSTRGGGVAEIWLLDLAARKYSGLTKGGAGSFRPSWSPDGKWIAFSSDRDTRRPGRAEPAWELLQSTAIYVVGPDGRGLRRITEAGGYYGNPQWSPDGMRIVCYKSKVKDVFPNRQNGRAESQIVSIDVATGEQQAHTSGPGFRLSPRYLGAGEIGYVVKFGERRGLAFTSGREGAAAELRHPSWSPDGKTVVYQRNGGREQNRMKPAFNRDPRFELYLTGSFPAYSPRGDRMVLGSGQPGMTIMDADGTNAKPLFNAEGKTVVFPAWSPDGKEIAFAVGGFFARPPRPGQLALIRPDGSDLRMLTKGETSSGFPSWSPDGKRLVYRVMGAGEQGLRILSLEDGRITRLTTEYDTFPMWSPKGDRIAFTSFRDGDYEIYTIRPDGTDARKLTNTKGNDSHSIYSSDGRYILFSSSRMGWKDEAMLYDRGPQPYGELFIMREDGGGARQLTDNQWEDATPAWLPKTAQ